VPCIAASVWDNLELTIDCGIFKVIFLVELIFSTTVEGFFICCAILAKTSTHYRRWGC